MNWCLEVHYVIILCQIYYIILLRKIASLPPNLATAGGLTARFPAVARSWCIQRIIFCLDPNTKSDALKGFVTYCH